MARIVKVGLIVAALVGGTFVSADGRGQPARSDLQQKGFLSSDGQNITQISGIVRSKVSSCRLNRNIAIKSVSPTNRFFGFASSTATGQWAANGRGDLGATYQMTLKARRSRGQSCGDDVEVKRIGGQFAN